MSPGTSVDKQRVAVMAYSWNYDRSRQPDHYINSLVKAFANLGYNVDVYIANTFTQDGGIGKFSDETDENNLIKFIKQRKYSLVLSFNNAMLTDNVLKAVGDRVGVCLVDELNHLFDHSSMGYLELYRQNEIKIFVSSRDIYKRLMSELPDSEYKLCFIPTATDTAFRDLSFVKETGYQHNISIVMSFLETNCIRHVLTHSAMENPDLYQSLIRWISIIRNGGSLPNDGKDVGEVKLLLDHLRDPLNDLERHIQNYISDEDRIHAVSTLSDLGLVLFGNLEWIGKSAKIDSVFRYGERYIASHSDLMKIYCSSKLCVNIPQFHCGNALPYRVVDVMASRALLITKKQKESDLYTIFGTDCAVPTYESQSELRDLCLHYLNNEEERLERVQKCNYYVSKGFSFRERCIEIVEKIGETIPPPSQSGQISILDQGSFRVKKNARWWHALGLGR